ncbi:oxidoreductase domain protein [Isosphaera pallida ATCC 43644]|uniref:Oxidoreductase domain protein n=1 Tax=Isosphaera pallida (strain ATCC 43644 / DSM 9630 / IS1B) TaxID=575540 RepID=E8QYA3_ISOPI|nr:Gfo/Idh/MocA family oxidoreductase [Isosphaera pallida]ADV63098.1 oxidoreductase domain protein [Isosphaera pallida ATCC 43644]
MSGSFTRRDFLGWSLGTGAAVWSGFPTVVPASALGRGGWVAPSARIRLGHIGVANQGTSNLKAFFGCKNSMTTAVCDVDRDHLAAAAALVEKTEGQARSCLTFGDYRKLIESPEVDAVVVTTPDHWHALPVIDACAANKPVYVEKPLSLTITEGRLMVQAARRAGVAVQTGSQQRSDARFRLACELVRSGALGRIESVIVGLPGVNFQGPAVADSPPPAQLDYDFWLGPAPKRPYNAKRVHYNFRFFWDYSGGQLTNWGAHHLDIVQWALGMDESGPLVVEAYADFHPEGWFEVPTRSHVTYEYAGGVTVRCVQGGKERHGVTFVGSQGTLFVDRNRIEANPPELLRVEPTTRLTVSKNHHANWLEAIVENRRPLCDVEIGHRSATVCHLGNLAIRTAINRHFGEDYRDIGRVEWEPTTETIVAFSGRPNPNSLLNRPYRQPWSLPSFDPSNRETTAS